MEAICQFALFADDRPPPSGNCYLWVAQSTFREFSVKSYQVGFLYHIHRSPGKILVQGRVYHEFDPKKLLTKNSGRERGIFYSGPEEKVDSIWRRRGGKTLYEKTRRASVSYIRGKEADSDTAVLKNLVRK